MDINRYARTDRKVSYIGDHIQIFVKIKAHSECPVTEERIETILQNIEDSIVIDLNGEIT